MLPHFLFVLIASKLKSIRCKILLMLILLCSFCFCLWHYFNNCITSSWCFICEFQSHTFLNCPFTAAFSQILLWRFEQNASNQHFRSSAPPFSPILAQSSPSGCSPFFPFQLSGCPMLQNVKLRVEEQK